MNRNSGTKTLSGVGSVTTQISTQIFVDPNAVYLQTPASADAGEVLVSAQSGTKLATSSDVKIGDVVTTAGGKTLTSTLQTDQVTFTQPKELVTKGYVDSKQNTALGAVTYCGVYNAATNTPDLLTGTHNEGCYFIVSAAGSQPLNGAPPLVLNVADWLIRSPTRWEVVEDSQDELQILLAKTAALSSNGRFQTPCLPETNNVVDLGDTIYRWRHIFMLGWLRCNGSGLAVDHITNGSEVSGIDLLPGGLDCKVRLTGSDYQGQINRAVTLDSTGTLTRSGATISASGVVTANFRGAEYLDSQGVNGLYVPSGGSALIQYQNTAYKGLANRICTHGADGGYNPTVATCTSAGALACKQITCTNVVPEADNTYDAGTASARVRDVYANGVKSLRNLHNAAGRGIEFSGTTTAADVVFTSNPYVGNTNNSIVTIGNTGAIKVPSSNARVDSLGNLDCRNAVLTSGDLEIATSGKKVYTDIVEVKTNAGGPLKLNSYQGKGVSIENTSAANVTLSGDSYSNSAGKILVVGDAAGKLRTSTTLTETSIEGKTQKLDAATGNPTTKLTYPSAQAITSLHDIPNKAYVDGLVFTKITGPAGVTSANKAVRYSDTTGYVVKDSTLVFGDTETYPENDLGVDVGRPTKRFKDANFSGFTSNSTGFRFNNLVGPGTLRVDANGWVSVLLDPLAPAIVTPHNLTSATSDPNFTVITSSVWQGDEAGLGGWRCFDEASTNGHHSSAQYTYSNGVQVTGAIAPMPTSGSWIAAVFSSDRTVTKLRYKAYGVNIPADFTVARFNGTTWIDTGFSVTNAIQNPGVYVEYTIPGANGGGGVWRGIALIVSRLSLPDTGYSNCLSLTEIDFQ
jgi:hypothetical protein